MINPRDYVWDIETYPNVFLAYFIHIATGQRWVFEISHRRDDTEQLVQFIMFLRGANARMIGFNSIGFDYPVLHDIMAYRLDVRGIYEKAMNIINSNDKFSHIIWDRERLVEQIDLYKIHHFDNQARATSLKMLEFNMRSPNIEDLPFPVGTLLTSEQIDVLIQYNGHDCDETVKFYHHSLDMIRFREEMSKKYGRNFMNHNDTKIGKDYFIMELEKAGIQCYEPGSRRPRQSRRTSIALSNVVLDSIQFYHPALQRIRDWMVSQTIVASELKPNDVSTKGVFKDINANLDGFQIDFGMGGAHGSINSQTVYSDDEWVIIDKDVTSYYPSLFIANDFYPGHLGKEFCDIYKGLKEQRMQYAKGTAENAMLKLALNGAFGDTGNEWSPFFDKLCMMRITINGQLQIAMLAEQLIAVPELQLIQVNTDGLTVRVKRDHVDRVEKICNIWQSFTGLELEDAIYSRMFIRDVNNYIAEYVKSGKLKRKGAYEYEMDWHQNHSSLIIPKAAEAALVHGQDIGDFIYNHKDIYDFMLRTKVPRSSKLMWGTEQLQNIARYYISTDGNALTKVSPPPEGYEVGQFKRKSGITDELYYSVLAESRGFWNAQIHTKNQSRYEERRMGINVGWLTTPCNDINDAHWDNINYDYYIQEAEKLVRPLR